MTESALERLADLTRILCSAQAAAIEVPSMEVAISGALGNATAFGSLAVPGEGRPGAVIRLYDQRQRRLEPAESEILNCIGALVLAALEREHLADVSRARRIGHNLKSPLTVIVGFNHFLAASPALAEDPVATEATRRIAVSAHQIQSVIENLVRYVIPGSPPRIEDVDLVETVSNAVGDLSPSGVPPRVVRRVDPVVLPADRVQLRALLRILLANAFAYSHPDRDADVEVCATANPRGWQLVVVDNGLGVPEHHRERIRQPYVRLERDLAVPGTGVGLAVAERIARAHGGQLQIAATPGGGTTVRVSGRT